MLGKKHVIFFLLTVLVLGLVVTVRAEEVDFGGKSITILCNWEFIDPQGEQAKEIMAKYNIGEIKILTVPWEEILDTTRSRLLSNDSTYDIWFLGHTFPHPLLKENALYPVSDILGMEYYESLPAIKKNMADIMTLDQSKRYFIATNDQEYSNIVYVYWNKDLFKEQGLPSLYELYKGGKWTYAAMEEIAKMATIDKDNDGKIDQWGINRIHHKDWMLTNGGDYVHWKDGKLEIGMGDKVVTALSYLNKWKNVDKILKSANYEDDEIILSEFFEGKAAMTVAAGWEVYPDAMEAKYSVVPLPKGPDAEEHSHYMMTCNGYYLPINTAEPEKMVKLIQALSPMEEYEYRAQDSLQWFIVDKESAEILTECVENPNSHSFYEAIFAVDDFWLVLDEIVAGKKTPATGLNEIKPAINARIEEYNQYIVND